MYGRTIAQLMKNNFIDTKYELAKLSGLRAPTIAHILNDQTKKPNPNSLKKLADVFGMSALELKIMATGNIHEEIEA